MGNKDTQKRSMKTQVQSQLKEQTQALTSSHLHVTNLIRRLMLKVAQLSQSLVQIWRTVSDFQFFKLKNQTSNPRKHNIHY